MNNIEKKNKYVNLMSKLTRATNNEYYYEAIFIEYSIIEDRTESILRHANIKYQENNGQNFKLTKKLNIIKSRKEFHSNYIKKHITDELLENIYEWKKQRDKIMHDIIRIEYGNEDIKNIALNGECLVKRLNNKTKLINSYLDKVNLEVK